MSLAGIDIDLARDLAAPRCRWNFSSSGPAGPRLSEDLLAGEYDVAMSGVSRTLDRARIGHLSLPYYIGGKMPIARCEDQSRFGSLADIDQPGVRVIVNPGGTNERSSTSSSSGSRRCCTRTTAPFSAPCWPGKRT